jgi:hypothetical protein
LRIVGERIVPVTVMTTVAVCLILGLAAALIGGSLNSFGDGPGGLSGFPGLVLFLLSLVGIVSAIGTRSDLPRTAVTIIGPLAVAIAFFFVAHLLDPCVTGTWNLSTELGGGPACELYGSELNVTSRFHLLLHALVAAPVTVLYWLALERVRGALQNSRSTPVHV